MTEALPTVALVVVAYGHATTLPATLAALARLDYPRELRTTVVVENGAGDSAAVARSFEEVRLLEPGRNLGFAGGSNLGAAAVESDVVVLINPDLEPRPSFLRALVAPLGKPAVGAVGAKLLFPDGATIQHAGGHLQGPIALGQHDGYGEPDRGQYDQARNVDYVTGAALAVRRSTWERFGGLDEQFFPAYYEEVDLCWRLRAAGLAVRYEPAAVALHQEAAGQGTRTADYQRLFHRNRLRLLLKHRSDAWLVQHWLPAELAYIRAVADDAELAGLAEAYGAWQAALVAGVDPGALGPAEPPAPRNHLSELEWTLQQLGAKHAVAPEPFRSRLPLVARIRTWLNRLTTEEYLRPLLQRQNDYNLAVADFATAISRQRRAADAAIMCQGMLLAKLRHSLTA